MTNVFIKEKIDIKNIQKEDCSYDMYFLENNEGQIAEICKFFEEKERVLAITGFCGVGKTAVVDFVCDYLNENVLTLKYTCLETTTLDDLFLSFFESFRNYTIQGKIPLFRTKTENFSQKINSYFTKVQLPKVVILNSFEALLKENKQSIINFLNTLLEMDNIKIILTSRKFITDGFDDSNIKNVPILALSQNIFEKYLRANGVKHIGVLSNELYNQTKGYFGYVRMSIRVMALNNLLIGDFLEKYSKSLTPFAEFIYREGLLFVDPVSAHLFRLLTLMRIPIHINLIKTLHLYNQERINFFESNGLLVKDGDYIYLKDYVRSIVENQIPESVISKLHSACIDLYDTQLPLKPMERDLKLSRQTMRNEIEYHKMFLPRRPLLNFRDVRVVENFPVVKKDNKPQEIVEKVKVENIQPVVEQTKEEKIKNISFIIEDEGILDDIANSISDFVQDNDNKTKFVSENSKLTLTQILNLAKQHEQNKNYEEVIMLYQSALTKKDDANFYRFLPNIYLYMANVYKKMTKWYEAIECYTQAQDFYFNVGNTDKLNEIKFEIANIYSIIYKNDNAKFILDELEKNPTLSNELRIKVNITQAKLCNNINKEFLYYKKSVPIADIDVDKSLAAELYYKFAGLNDEKNDINTAVKYYKKCILADSDSQTNRFLVGAYVNLGEIYFESGYNEPAIKYLTDALNIEKNPLNLYDISMRIAEIYTIINRPKALPALNDAITFAQKSADSICISEAFLALGDYYAYEKNFSEALKNYLQSQKFSTSNEKKNAINNKIENVKLRISESELEQILRENEE